MPSTIDETIKSLGNTPRAEYEQRELASDAVPLYSIPDDVVQGDHGLVRSILLNDRLRTLTVDILGEVVVWDVVRGVCLGRYLREDVTAARAAEGATGATEIGKVREGSHCSSLELGGYQNRCFDGPIDRGVSRWRYTLMVWRRFIDELRSKFGFLVFRLSITLYPLLLYPRGTADASKSVSREYES